jgi:hypothetical protein
VTKEKAILWLRKYLRDHRPLPHARTIYYPFYNGWKYYTPAQEYCYTKTVVNELIDWITQSIKEPLEVVHGFYQFLDDILIESDDGRARSHTIISRYETIAGDIYYEMKKEGEKECR